MSSFAETQHLEELLRKSEDALNAGQKDEATHVLREASAIAPQDARILQALDKLRRFDNAVDISVLYKQYLQAPSEAMGEKAVQAAITVQLSASDVSDTLAYLLKAEDAPPLKDRIVQALISRADGRHALADMLCHRVTETFRALWDTGERSLFALLTTLLTPDIWAAQEDRIKAEEGVATLLMAKMLEPAVVEPERAMRALGRLLSTDAKQLTSVVCTENLEIILLALDLSNPAALRSQAILVTAKLLEVAPERATDLLKQFVISRVSKPSIDELVAAFSVAAAIFPIVPTVASSLFITEGFVDDLVDILGRSQSSRLRHAVLELLNAACIDKLCRELIAEKCTVWLKEVVDERREDRDQKDAGDTAMAALILLRMRIVSSSSPRSQDVETDLLVSLFKEFVLKAEDPAVHSSIEGLAYGSTQASIKQSLADDSTFLQSIAELLQYSLIQGPVLFGALTIVSNLTAYSQTLSPEQKRMLQLQAQANLMKTTDADPLDDDDHVNVRCAKVIDAGVVPALVKCSKSSSPSIMQLISNITLSLTKHPKKRGVLVQQGLFDTMIRYANLDASKGADARTRRQASLALARTLIPIDPALIFTTHPVASAIRPLISLLQRPELDVPGITQEDIQDLQPPFEALRALTNLASLDDPTRILITEQAFPQISTHLWSNTSALVQAATECILNLTLSHAAISRFVANSHSNAPTDLLELISALTHSQTRGTRLAATATLTHLLAWQEGAVAARRLEKGLERLVDVVREAVEERDAEWAVRGVMAVWLLVGQGTEEMGEEEGAVGRIEEEVKNRIRRAGGVEVFQAVKRLGDGTDGEMGEMVDGILEVLKN